MASLRASRAGTPRLQATPAMTPQFTPAQTPMPTPGQAADEEIDWARVDAAMDYFASLDVVEMAQLIVERSISKGPKEIFNEIGPVKFQLSRARAMYRNLEQTICAESLQAKLTQIEHLERIIAKKRQIVAPSASPTQPE